MNKNYTKKVLVGSLLPLSLFAGAANAGIISELNGNSVDYQTRDINADFSTGFHQDVLDSVNTSWVQVDSTSDTRSDEADWFSFNAVAGQTVFLDFDLVSSGFFGTGNDGQEYSGYVLEIRDDLNGDSLAVANNYWGPARGFDESPITAAGVQAYDQSDDGYSFLSYTFATSGSYNLGVTGKTVCAFGCPSAGAGAHNPLRVNDNYVLNISLSNASATQVSEPSTFAILALTILGLGARKLKAKR